MLFEITGVVDDIKKGTLSGYWIEFTPEASLTTAVRCGLKEADGAVARSLKKGDMVTCRGEVGSTWTSLHGKILKFELVGALRYDVPVLHGS